MTASDALYGFAAWLTTRPQVVTISSAHDSAPVAELVSSYIDANGLGEVSSDYPDNLRTPNEGNPGPAEAGNP